MSSKSRFGRNYGWKKDKLDIRDKKYPKVGLLKASVLPDKVDLRSKCPDVYDQGSLGSCTGNSIAAAHQFEQMKQGLADAFQPSRLFIYYGEREIEGHIAEDSGAQIRDGIKFVAASGVCPEDMWRYDISQFTTRPSSACYDVAAGHKVVEYLRLDNTNINQLKQCLADGFGFSFGFTVYESFESDGVARTGVVPMPKPEEQVLGGHAVFCVGFSDSLQCFIVRNSWSSRWGDNGYCYMPYAMLTNPGIASDFWTIRLVNDAPIPVVQKSWWQSFLDWL